jgi:tetratricopeptide repeat protein 30
MNNLYEGQYTSFIYGLIKEENYTEAIRILNMQLEMNPRSRAALSLLGYCNYLSSNFAVSAEMYEQLIKYYPEVTEYRVYYAQSLYKAEKYEEALKACMNIQKEELSHQITILQFAIRYQMNELADTHQLLHNTYQEKQDTLVCQGCLAYKEGKYEEAKVKFEEAKKLGENPDIEYNIGVCCYKLEMLSASCVAFQNILEHAAKTHPELVMPNRLDGIRTASMANMPAL